MQPLAAKFLKKWVGLATPSNTAILFEFLPTKKGGLALPSLVMLYKKKLQATRMVQLFRSHDPGVRKAADFRLAEERGRQRIKFRPAYLVDSIISEDHHQSSKALSAVSKTLLVEAEDYEKHQSLCKLSLQGEMARSWEGSSPELWARAAQDLPPEPIKFALNASLNTLPTNANLHT